MSISETATREQLIDPLLKAAGWNLKDRTQVDFEIPVDGYDKEPWNGITDYCLFDLSGEVLAVVEAPVQSRRRVDRLTSSLAIFKCGKSENKFCDEITKLSPIAQFG